MCLRNHYIKFGWELALPELKKWQFSQPVKLLAILNLVILLWWLDFSLMNLFWCFSLNHIFTLGSCARCQHWSTFHLNQGVRTIFFWLKQLQTFSIILISPSLAVKTPELEASLDEPDVMTSPVPSGFLCSIGTLSDNSKLQLVHWMKSHKLRCQARVLPLPGPLAG